MRVLFTYERLRGDLMEDPGKSRLVELDPEFIAPLGKIPRVDDRLHCCDQPVTYGIVEIRVQLGRGAPGSHRCRINHLDRIDSIHIRILRPVCGEKRIIEEIRRGNALCLQFIGSLQIIRRISQIHIGIRLTHEGLYLTGENSDIDVRPGTRPPAESERESDPR